MRLTNRNLVFCSSSVYGCRYLRYLQMMLFYLLPVLQNALEGDPQLDIIMAYYGSYSTICGQFVDEILRSTL